MPIETETRANLEQALRNDIPLARAMDLHIGAWDGDRLEMHAPLAPNINDKGCAFGGSLASVMTLAGWSLIHLATDAERLDCDLYVQDCTIRYLAPVWGEIRAVARLDEGESFVAFLDALRPGARLAVRAGRGAGAAGLHLRRPLRRRGPRPCRSFPGRGRCGRIDACLRLRSDRDVGPPGSVPCLAAAVRGIRAGGGGAGVRQVARQAPHRHPARLCGNDSLGHDRTGRELRRPRLARGAPADPLELERYKQVRFTGYNERPAMPVGDFEVHQRVEIGLVNVHTQEARTIIDDQIWKFDRKAKSWTLHSGLPDLTRPD